MPDAGQGRPVGPLVGTVVFLFLAPGLVDGVAPWWMTGWRRNVNGFTQTPGAHALGLLLILCGLGILLDSFLRFAFEGRGTPAPPFPTRQLVVGGPYRFVRNPMYLANFAIILGQALWFGNVCVLLYAGAVALASFTFVMLYEEPKLRKTYGAEYERYCAEVPRWIPRMRAWQPGER